MDQTHLSYRATTNLGSFYTPPKLVRVVAEMICKNTEGTKPLTVLDSSCGYGAFFSAEMQSVPAARFVGGDIDSEALEIAEKNNPHVDFFEANALFEISREKYGITSEEPLLVVSNPPYNDTTSLVKNSVKTAFPCEIDTDIKTRDLGISFLLSFEKLRPDFIAVLHPLSYLIKQTNFNLLAPLFQNYSLADSVVVNSQEFAGTSRGNGFPILIAFYKKDARGWSYSDVQKYVFRTLCGDKFSISDFDYIKNYISKYPNRSRRDERGNADFFKFFTMRDINALKRSRTFISNESANTIHVPVSKLEYYCYVDVFKDFAGTLPYYLGNFDVMFDSRGFLEIKNDFLTLSIAKHPEIFEGKFAHPAETEVFSARGRVKNYFSNLLKRHVYQENMLSNIDIISKQ